MKIGLCFPYTQEYPSREVMLEWFRRVDEGPFSTLSCGERMVGPSVDMMGLLGAAAAVTERVQIAPTLYVLPMHPAVKVAKHAATLDVISGGRTIITVGVGGRVHDYRCMEKEPVRRYARMDEQVAEIRRHLGGRPALRGHRSRSARRPVQAGGPHRSWPVSWDRRPSRAVRSGPTATTRGPGTACPRRSSSSATASSRPGTTARPRRRPRRRMAGFWYSLAPDADAKLKAYVYKYIKVIGEPAAKFMASQVDRSSPDAVRASLDAYEELGHRRMLAEYGHGRDCGDRRPAGGPREARLDRDGAGVVVLASTARIHREGVNPWVPVPTAMAIWPGCRASFAARAAATSRAARISSPIRRRRRPRRRKSARSLPATHARRGSLT